MLKNFLFHLLFCVIFLTGCNPPQEPVIASEGSTPTTHPFFSQKTPISAFPTIDPVLLTPEPLQTQQATSVPVIPAPSDVISLTIFDEELNSNWVLEASAGLTYLEGDTTAAQTGEGSLEITGQDGSSLTFKVLATSPDRYLRDNVLGLRFWLYTGENKLEVDELIVEVFGSDRFHYWVWNDNSASQDIETFSRKRFYGLGLNNLLEPDTWIPIEILLDDLVYDPNFDDDLIEEPIYEYVTGFSILFVEGFSGTIYLDDVQFLIRGID